MPDKNVEKHIKLHGPVLGVFAKQDKWITPEVVKEFQSNMSSAEGTLQLRMYDADHAFANPSNPQFDKESTEDAWNTSLEFFNMHLVQ
jgi:carboxymethylenebutenolidase